MKEQNLKRIVTIVLVVGSIFTIAPIAASASWKQDNYGWWNTEGSSWSVSWRQIDGKWYYFGQDGYMAHDTVIDGYKLGSDGAWIQSTQNSSSNSEEDVREIAFNQLIPEAKKSIKGTWQDSKISIITLDELMGNLNDKSYIGKEVYRIDFPIEYQLGQNEISVFIGMDNHKLIGYGISD
jgi:hypothetical protein